MKCDHCDSAMSLSSTVCTQICCSFSYECGICGRQRLTSEPIPPGQRTATQWPDKSGYNPGKTIAPDHRARHILDNTADNSSYRPAAEVSFDATADTADIDDDFVTLDSATTGHSSRESAEDLARDFNYTHQRNHSNQHPQLLDDHD